MVLPVPAPPTTAARRTPRSVLSTCICSSVSRTTSRWPSLISDRSSDRSSSGEVIIAASMSMPCLPGDCGLAARPQLVRRVDPRPQARVAQAVGLEHRAIDDQVGVGVRPEEEDLGAEAGDLRVREGDGVARHRLEPGRPVGQLA